MHDFLFYFFAALTLGSAIMVVASRNAVNAAMFLILAFLGVAAHFLLLEAAFLAVLQVLVYAGAVVVLFLFIIMLLDIQGGRAKPLRQAAALGGFASFAALAGVAIFLFRPELLPTSDLAGVAAPGASLKDYGAALFTSYLLPVQVVGFLLLIAMIGVIVLSRRDARGDSGAPRSVPGTTPLPPS